jgi:polyphosphate kinase
VRWNGRDDGTAWAGRDGTCHRDLLQSPDRFINREFSWLQFNRRVLEETLNTAHPLLERVRFLSISAANLDEFFMVRVAGLEGQVRQGIAIRSPDGKTSGRAAGRHPARRSTTCRWSSRPRSPSCSSTSPRRTSSSSGRLGALRRRPRLAGQDAFDESIFPVLTPLSIDPAHPFPFIPNLGFSIALQLESKTAASR